MTDVIRNPLNCIQRREPTSFETIYMSTLRLNLFSTKYSTLIFSSYWITLLIPLPPPPMLKILLETILQKRHTRWLRNNPSLFYRQWKLNLSQQAPWHGAAVYRLACGISETGSAVHCFFTRSKMAITRQDSPMDNIPKEEKAMWCVAAPVWTVTKLTSGKQNVGALKPWITPYRYLTWYSIRFFIANTHR